MRTPGSLLVLVLGGVTRFLYLAVKLAENPPDLHQFPPNESAEDEQPPE